MKGITQFATAGAVLALLSAPALASDLNGKGRPSLPEKMEFAERTEVVNWTGFYVGGHVGYGNANHDLTVRKYGHDETERGETLGFSNGLNSPGPLGGGDLGFDWARGRVLLGVFGRYSFTGMEHETAGISIGSLDLDATLEKQDEWSVGARAGLIVAPKTLVYVLAAYTQTEYELNGLSRPVGAKEWKTSATFDGVSIGGGIEFALTGNTFLGLEYVHTFYGDEDLFKLDRCNCGAAGENTLDEDKIMATLKVKLNGGLFNPLD